MSPRITWTYGGGTSRTMDPDTGWHGTGGTNVGYRSWGNLLFRFWMGFVIPALPEGATGIESASLECPIAGSHGYLDGIPVQTDGASNYGAALGLAGPMYGTFSPAIDPAYIVPGEICYIGIIQVPESGGSHYPDAPMQLYVEFDSMYQYLNITWSYPPAPTEPTVTTLPASDLDWFKRTATLNGESLNGEFVALKQVYFKWGGEALEQNSVKVPAAGNFSVYLHGATRDWWYYFQAVGIDAHGNEYYGEVLSFMLTQDEAQPAYVTKLIIRGQPLVPLETITLFAKDAASISKYGRRSYSLSTQYSLNQDDTQVILNTILADNKDPRVNNLSITFQNLKPGAYKDSVIAADISTRITLINTLLGLDGDFFINNVKHTVIEGGTSYTVQWRLERIYDTTPEP